MNIYLRYLEEKDAAGMLEWMTDPMIVCFFRFDASKITLDSCREFIAASDKERSTRHYAIVDEKDTYLGTISLKNIDQNKKSAEYAISTRKCAHGTGAAMKATQGLLCIAFLELGLERVYLNVMKENGRANKFYRKAGFSFIYCEEHAVEIRNEWKDLNWYEISRTAFIEEYENGK